MWKSRKVRAWQQEDFWESARGQLCWGARAREADKVKVLTQTHLKGVFFSQRAIKALFKGTCGNRARAAAPLFTPDARVSDGRKALLLGCCLRPFRHPSTSPVPKSISPRPS